MSLTDEQCDDITFQAYRDYKYAMIEAPTDAMLRAIVRAAYAAGERAMRERAELVCLEPHFTCCGKPCVGAEYMGQQEIIWALRINV